MILISAGHYPERPGAHYQDFYEHDEAVRWVAELMNIFEGKAESVPTGRLGEKVNWINKHIDAEVALEVHFNQTANGLPSNTKKWSGSLTLFCPGSTKGEQLAESVQSKLEPIFGMHWHGVMEGWYRMDKRNGPDYFLAKTKCPAIIIEPEFIFRRGYIQSNRTQACEGIAQAVLETLESWKNV